MNELLHLVKVIPEKLAISVGPKSAERWRNAGRTARKLERQCSLDAGGGPRAAPSESLAFQVLQM
jgi:hypothetical protein